MRNRNNLTIAEATHPNSNRSHLHANGIYNTIIETLTKISSNLSIPGSVYKCNITILALRTVETVKTAKITMFRKGKLNYLLNYEGYLNFSSITNHCI